MVPLTLQTDRLLLRPFEAGDGAAFHAYMSDPDVTRYAPFTPLSRERSQELVQEMVDSSIRAWNQNPPDFLTDVFAITLRETEQLIGSCRIGRSKAAPEEADVAYYLNRHYWGHGYATEAVKALIGYSFARLGLRRIVALCVSENVASRRVMEKAGMQPEGTLTLYAADGNWHQDAFKDVTYLRYAIHAHSE